jgi:hypothetical protein
MNKERVMDDEADEQEQAAQALATVQAHRERTRQATRTPWWVYALMFILTAGVTATNDFVGVTGAKIVAAAILVLFAAVILITFVSRSAPLNWMRGVQPRQSFNPRVFFIIVVLAGLGKWLASHYGTDIAHTVASAVGLSQYPNTVAGVFYGAAFTALFALGRLLLTVSQRRTEPQGRADR